jgi:hypothetical protein
MPPSMVEIAMSDGASKFAEMGAARNQIIWRGIFDKPL